MLRLGSLLDLMVSVRVVGRGALVLGCIYWASISLGQPSAEVKEAFRAELEARRAGAPFAEATDPRIARKLIRGKVRTQDKTDFRFDCKAGTMLHLSSLPAGERYSFVMAPYLSLNSAGQPNKLPSNGDNDADLVVQAFRIDGKSISETKFSAISSKHTEVFIDNGPGGSGSEFSVEGIVDFGSDKGETRSASCCVACGSYQVCGCKVTSSCGSCCASGCCG